MPRFHFHLGDGISLPDRDGTELPDIAVARVQAVRHFGELLTFHPEQFWAGDQWTMTVTDEAGLTLFTLFFGAVDAPAALLAQPVVQAQPSAGPRPIPDHGGPAGGGGDA